MLQKRNVRQFVTRYHSVESCEQNIGNLNNVILISNFRRALNVVCFLLGDSPASEIYMPTFRNALFHLHRQVGVCRMNSAEGNVGVLYGKRFGLENHFPSQTFSRIIPQHCPQPSSFYTHLPAYEDGTVCSETSAYKFQTPGNHPKESIQH